MTGAPFPGWLEAKSATASADPPAGNYVRYRSLTGAAQTFSLNQIDDNSVSIHGFQIIESGADTDGDGLKDITEIEYGLNPAVADASGDLDGDGLSNAAEIALGTNLRKKDTDNDGLEDGLEATHLANPLVADTDGDGLLDGGEVFGDPYPSRANLADSDGDGFSDAVEKRGGSNPLSAASKPPGVPVWNAATRTWTWNMRPLRLRWNHSRSMLGAITSDESMVAEAIVNRAGTDWNGRIALGIRYINGRVTHRFYCGNGVFHVPNAPSDGLWNSDWVTYPVDKKAALGFSGFGTADGSDPLAVEFSATRVNATENRWTLVFRILNIKNTASPVTVATWTYSNAVAADNSLLAGTTAWTDVSGNANAVSIETEQGVAAFFDSGPLGPVDTDKDGMPDTWETQYSLLPNNAADGVLDPDGDGLSNLDEWRAGTNPRNPDSDGDGLSDGVEIAHGSAPFPRHRSHSRMPSAAAPRTWMGTVCRMRGCCGRVANTATLMPTTMAME